MTFENAKLICHIRSAIYRASKSENKYYKNHTISLDKRVSTEDQDANDWEEYDPSDDYPPYYGLA